MNTLSAMAKVATGDRVNVFFQQSNNQAAVKARRASIPIRAMQGQCLSFNRSGGCMGNSDCSVSSGGCVRQQSLVDNRRN